MPKEYITFRTEYGYRHANVPYFSGRGGITSGVNTAPSVIPGPSAGLCCAGYVVRDRSVIVSAPGFTCVAEQFLPRPQKQ